MGKIWDPLFTTKVTGIGLGLPIIKTMVEAHGALARLRSSFFKRARILDDKEEGVQ